jgi:hypothetical protein
MYDEKNNLLSPLVGLTLQLTRNARQFSMNVHFTIIRSTTRDRAIATAGPVTLISVRKSAADISIAKPFYYAPSGSGGRRSDVCPISATTYTPVASAAGTLSRRSSFYRI